MDKRAEDSHLGSLWPRFSAYSVSKTPALTIRPTASAELVLYDPWEADRSATSEDQRPYKQLLRIAQRTRPGTTRFDMPRRQRQQLEQWVRSNGLLGILPHETLSFRNAPHWHETPVEEESSDSRKRSVRRLAPYQIEVHRLGDGWQSTYHRVGADHPLSTARRSDPTADTAISDSALPAETIYRSWPQGKVASARLGRRFEAFFPGQGLSEVEMCEYAPPSTKTFWRSYGEPLGMLLRYAHHLADALSAFEVSPRTESWQDANAFGALQDLNDAASGSSLVGCFHESGEVHLEWSGTSLLSCFATLILQDLAGGQRVMRCPVCGSVFLSSAHQAKYCSPTCRYTYHKREQRRRDADLRESQ